MERIELEHRLDRDARRFLAAVQYFGGEATTTEIRSRTGLSSSVVHTRYDVLEDLDLITIGYADHGVGDRTPPKVARLTGRGRAAIEWGILHDIDTSRTPDEIRDLQTEVRTLHDEIATLRQRVTALTEGSKQQAHRISDLEHQQDWLFRWSEGAEDAIIDLTDEHSQHP